MLQDIRLAIVVDPNLPLGILSNTVAAISVGIGAALPELGARRLTDIRQNTIDISSNRPVPILQADPATIRLLMLKALAEPDERAIVPFPSFARSLHDYADYAAAFPKRNLEEEAIDGLGIAGPAKWVKSLTGSLKLLR